MIQQLDTMKTEGAGRLTRRRWLGAAGAALVLDGCARRTEKWSPVSIHRLQGYSESLYDLVRRVIDEHRLDVRGKRVVLKPNLVEFDERTVINTNPKLVHAAFEAFRAAGAATSGRGRPGASPSDAGPGGCRWLFLHDSAIRVGVHGLNVDQLTHVALVKPHYPAAKLFTCPIPC